MKKFIQLLILPEFRAVTELSITSHISEGYTKPVQLTPSHTRNLSLEKNLSEILDV